MPGLDLDIASLTRPGRKPTPAAGAFVRELKVEDLPLLSTARGTEAPSLKRLSERHHALARALASGMSEGEAAAMVGLVSSRVSILKGTPAFRELVELYREDFDRKFLDTAARLAGLAHDAVAEIADRLETEPDEVSMGHLIEIAKLAADRSGLGPTQKQEVTVNNLADRINAARERAKARLIEDASFVEIKTDE